uniref:Uncharacterized protein n=1 Tax=Panagrolaimus davidi TaxID=227884 RepID=A0A914QWA2_9BILA
MSLPNVNGFGDGQNGCPVGYGPNNAPQFINQPSLYYTREQYHQQQPIPHRNVLENSPLITNPRQNSAVPVTHPINKSLEDINTYEMVQILDESGWNPNLTNDSPLVYETFEISSAANEQDFFEQQRNVNVNVAIFNLQNAFQPHQNSPPAHFPLFPQENRIVVNVEDINASGARPPSSPIGKRPVGRLLPIAEEAEKANLVKELANLKKVCDQILKANIEIFSVEEKNWVEQVLKQQNNL